MTEKELAFELSQFDNAWKEASVNVNDPLPDGDYQVMVAEARFDRNKFDDRLQFLFSFEVAYPAEFAGRRIWHRRSVDEKGIGFLKRDIAVLGVEFDSLSELASEDARASLLDKFVAVRLKASKPNKEGKTYQNCYVNKLLDGDFTPEEDIPF